jgi:hypothetical protein
MKEPESENFAARILFVTNRAANVPLLEGVLCEVGYNAVVSIVNPLQACSAVPMVWLLLDPVQSSNAGQERLRDHAGARC